uniref:Uncharacterized protein n=1 Tax=Oryza rufipogon TaxID=4529 RepID=A0A0E0Q141_ORYRU
MASLPHVRPSARRSPLLRPSSGASLRPLLLRPSSHAPLRPLLAARRSSAPSDLADRGRRRWPAIEDGGTVGRGGGTRQHGGSAVLVAAPSAELVAVKLFASSSLAGSGSAHAISEDVWAQRWLEIEGGMVGRGGGCSSKSNSSGAIPSSLSSPYRSLGENEEGARGGVVTPSPALAHAGAARCIARAWPSSEAQIERSCSAWLWGLFCIRSTWLGVRCRQPNSDPLHPRVRARFHAGNQTHP